ncbi:unnamed protein product [Adineta steineri]|uniref:Uncharacterized protein n=1 Tax=Adineta steineri TaxID=433720 RepID=A0A819VUH6_9BILA|nr:unnamed protein product [Adineta steineri]CAF4115296.1 unnamed protein product [Adineta steineri]
MSSIPNLPCGNATGIFCYLKLKYENQIQICKYCLNTATTNSWETSIQQIYGFTTNTTFRLTDEQSGTFSLTPIDLDNDEVSEIVTGSVLSCYFFVLFSIFFCHIDQPAIILEWIEGTSKYKLLLPVEKFSEEYLPLNVNYKIEIDTNNLKALQCLPNNDHQQTVSLSSNDLEKQLLRIIDSIQIKQNFGIHEQNLPRDEIIHHLYSPDDATSISLQQILIDSIDISARAFHRYRC